MSILFAQNQKLDSIQKLIANGENKKAGLVLKSIKSEKLNLTEKAKYLFLKGKYFELIGDSDIAFQEFLKAKKQYLNLNQKQKAMDINLDIAFLLSCFQNEKNLHQSYLDEYINYAKQINEPNILLKGYVQSATLKINTKETQESLQLFRKAIQLNKKVNNKILASKINNNLAILFSEVLKQHDSSLYYLKKDYELLNQNKDSLNLGYNLLNQASNYIYLSQFEKAISKLDEAKKIKLTHSNKYSQYKLNELYYWANKGLGNYEKGIKYYELSNLYKDSINEYEQNIAINDIETKYKTAEKEVENLKLKEKNKNNKILVLVSISLFLISLVISLLAYKNLSKKKKIAEQEKQLEIQKLENILKEQELHEIDLMLESQEKERQHIANELHDNLGSSLATLKMNFENLKSQKEHQELLFEKTEKLIEETYQKVRHISHLKNLGVIGNEGFLVAVKKMAEKMSLINKLKVNVIPYGLTERLENTIEISLFRMIQELCTNAIKHANASEINIYLTQHSAKDINLMIEDNGIGFDTKQVNQKDGIGLKNIEKKIEAMGGTFTIDSIPQKGTTLIIDLPL